MTGRPQPRPHRGGAGLHHLRYLYLPFVSAVVIASPHLQDLWPFGSGVALFAMQAMGLRATAYVFIFFKIRRETPAPQGRGVGF